MFFIALLFFGSICANDAQTLQISNVVVPTYFATAAPEHSFDMRVVDNGICVVPYWDVYATTLVSWYNWRLWGTSVTPASTVLPGRCIAHPITEQQICASSTQQIFTLVPAVSSIISTSDPLRTRLYFQIFIPAAALAVGSVNATVTAGCLGPTNTTSLSWSRTIFTLPVPPPPSPGSFSVF